MWSSAMASSSPVVTPGRTAARTAAIAPATTRPAPRMSSSSCGVLIWIIRPLHFASSGSRPRIPAAVICARLPSARARPVGTPAPAGPERAHRPLGDLLDRADGVDAGQQSLGLVPTRQRGGLFPVDLQPVSHGLRLVVVPLDPLTVDEHPAAGRSEERRVGKEGR